MIALKIISIIAIFIHCWALFSMYTNPYVFYDLGVFIEKDIKKIFTYIIISLGLWVLIAILASICTF